VRLAKRVYTSSGKTKLYAMKKRVKPGAAKACNAPATIDFAHHTHTIAAHAQQRSLAPSLQTFAKALALYLEYIKLFTGHTRPPQHQHSSFPSTPHGCMLNTACTTYSTHKGA
jgi:hypothetical protein